MHTSGHLDNLKSLVLFVGQKRIGTMADVAIGEVVKEAGSDFEYRDAKLSLEGLNIDVKVGSQAALFDVSIHQNIFSGYVHFVRWKNEKEPFTVVTIRQVREVK